jgi:hypothetical protein
MYIVAMLSDSFISLIQIKRFATHRVSNKSIDLIADIKSLIEQSRQQVASTVNSAITLLYWQIGNRINEEILLHNRAEYGRQIVQTLSAKLVLEYGKGWGEKHLRHCLRIVSTFQKAIFCLYTDKLSDNKSKFDD